MPRLVYPMLWAVTAVLAIVVAALPNGAASWSRSLSSHSAQAQQAPREKRSRVARTAVEDEPERDADRYPETDAAAEAPSDANEIFSDDRELDAGGGAEALRGAEVLARVGREFILRADLQPAVDQYIRTLIQKNGGKPIPDDELSKIREALTRQALDSAITTKLALEAARTKHTEMIDENLAKIGQNFDDQELPRLLKQYKVRNAAALDKLMLQRGTSLERERQAFCEQLLARSWIGRAIQFDKEVTHEEMFEYYQAHERDYQVEAKARWEHLKVQYVKGRGRPDAMRARADVRIDRDAPQTLSRDDAYDLLAQMGNDAQDGRPFAELAEEHSTCSCRASGAVHDWTSPGALAFEQLDQALFSLPVGAMSEILDDGRGTLHIVRVIERQDAGIKPYEELQKELREKIHGQRRSREMKKYLAELREQIPVSTIYDEAEASKPETASTRRPRGRR